MEQQTTGSRVERSLDVMLGDAQRARKSIRRKLEYTTQNRDRLDLECSDLRTRMDELDERIRNLRGHIASRDECLEPIAIGPFPQPSEHAFNV